MNQPPAPPDPNALTQPIPIVQPPPRPSRQLQPQGPHRFGNVPLYLLARLVALAIDLFALAFVAIAIVSGWVKARFGSAGIYALADSGRSIAVSKRLRGTTSPATSRSWADRLRLRGCSRISRKR